MLLQHSIIRQHFNTAIYALEAPQEYIYYCDLYFIEDGIEDYLEVAYDRGY